MERLHKAVLTMLACVSVALSSGCTGSQDRGGDAGSASTAAAPHAGERPTSSAPAATPNPDELSGKVSRFYRLLNTPNAKSWRELTSTVSPAFLNGHAKTMMRDYGFISNARVSIDSVHSRNVGYTVDYDYVSDRHMKIGWRRVGRWTFVHGSAGWLLDDDKWNSVRVVSIRYPVGAQYTDVKDTAYPDGRHVIELPGGQVRMFTATNDGWNLAYVETPAPSTFERAQTTTPSNGIDRAPTHPYAQAVQRSYARPAGCEEVAVSDVYQDGAVLHLDDGRYLKVASYDTATTSVWVAPFDGLICDHGDKFTNKDDNETVDLAP